MCVRCLCPRSQAADLDSHTVPTFRRLAARKARHDDHWRRFRILPWSAGASIFILTKVYRLKVQQQLLALARALLRDRKILAMDEASSSLDLASDKAVQSTLRSTAFRSVTTLIIAHRTNTIRDCDRILVLGGGEIVELGTPAELLAKEDGAFRRLVDEQESRMST